MFLLLVDGALFNAGTKKLFRPTYSRLSVTKIFTHDWATVAAKSVRPLRQNKAGNGCQDIDNSGGGG